MTPYETPVRDVMTKLVYSIGPRASIMQADEMMARYGFSALPVLDDDERLVGVLSRSDLLRVGRVRRDENFVLSLPNAPVSDHMKSAVEVVSRDTPLSEAARRMIRHEIHRLYVSEEGRLLGVVSTKEMIRAVVESRRATPIGELMRHSPVVAQASDSLSLAIDRMLSFHVAELVVMDGDWPVGTLSQEGALAAQNAPPDDKTEDWMDLQFICLPMGMPTHRAAQQTLATRARAILVVDARTVRGIVTGTDYTRLVAR